MKKDIDKIVENAIKNHVFTACSIGFTTGATLGGKRDIFNYGFAEGFDGVYPVDKDTIFDLASLTKPLVTSLCLLSLIKEGKIGTADTLDTFFATAPLEKRSISLLHLLTHSSGLPSHRPYYKKLVQLSQSKRMESLTAWILEEHLEFKPGTAHQYSDLGFMLLGIIIEKTSGESLHEYWKKNILQSRDNTIDHTKDHTKNIFFPGKQKNAAQVYANTGICEWSKKRLTGVVHDDNCRALGGVAGHAGLFGNCDAVLSLCEMIAMQFRGDQRNADFSSEKIKEILTKKKGSWLFGFDTPTAGVSSSGRYFSEMSLGHLGFTGTSFWIDLTRGICIVLLTNRVACGEATAGIKILRPLLHDTIMQFIIKKSG